MRKTLGNILTVLLILFGIGAILYPTLSDYWNRRFQSTGEAHYEESVNALDMEERQRMWDEAVAYNEGLLSAHRGVDPEYMPAYEDVLSLTDQGIMCTLHIPKIDLHATVRHGTDDGMLQTNIGHMPSSSMPVGGKGSHCALVGHRGLPSAMLFTELDALEEGDIFILDTLDVKLGYEVDQILTVLPHETEALALDPEQDLCTLITCTPYGVNSHRLLVRGHRVELSDAEIQRYVAEDPMRIEPFFIMLALAIVILIVFFILSRSKKKDREEEPIET